MFKNKLVAEKYELIGSPIQHVEGQGVMDLSKISLSTADYLFGMKFKGLKLKTVKPVDGEKSPAKK